MREFSSGATRDDDTTKPDYSGFLDPIVIRAFGEYMHKHRHQADGSMRAPDNWRKGIPRDVFMSSLFRHLVDAWEIHDDCKRMLEKNNVDDAIKSYLHEEMTDALCAILFNTQGYLSQWLRGDVGEQDE